MQKGLYIAVILIVVTACLFLMILRPAGRKDTEAAVSERQVLQKSIEDLKRRIIEIEYARDLADRTAQDLEHEVSSLLEEKQADRQVIQDLWTMLVASTRRQGKRVSEKADANQPMTDKRESVAQDTAVHVKYDAKAIKAIVASSGGNLEEALRKIMTTEGVNDVLQRHLDQPAYWTAAASLAPDRETALEVLKEAARLHPESAMVLAALVEAQISAGVFDESTLATLRELERLDPTNSLGDCYEAYYRFQSGDIAGAVHALSNAGAKGRFADARIDTLMARYDFLLNEGCSDPVAMGMSAFTLPLQHLGLLRQTGQQAVEQVHSLVAAGRYDEALQIARDISNIARTVSSSGRFLVHDRVGIALQESGLAEERRIFEALGDVRQVQEIDVQLGAIHERSSTIDVMVQAFGEVMAKMSEEDLARYVNQTILNGEFATLLAMPEVAEALAQIQANMEGTAQAAGDDNK
jgi:hypothetical protein